MERAGLNTLMGMGIVFLVLISLSLLNLFVQVCKQTGEKDGSTGTGAAARAAAAVEEDLTDDLELVAVITAAIAASEETSGDGFVVRSIKKVNRSKWQSLVWRKKR